MSTVLELFGRALDARAQRLDGAHDQALRLFNGYTEGAPRLAVDLYGQSLVVHDAHGPEGAPELVDQVVAAARARLPWLTAGLVKQRESDAPALRNGTLVFGEPEQLCRRVQEEGVSYALRLTLNRDASLYLDTAPLRTWAKQKLGGKRVLNAFAYTGSLSVAAKAGGATRVVSTDLNRAFLSVAKDSWALNRWPISRTEFLTGDFFDVVGRLKKENQLFDCVFVDPPFFSVTPQGRVDLERDMLRLINKVRPLVAHEGWLVALNNGVFVSGADFEKTLGEACNDGYLSVEERIDAPLDFAGYESTREGALPADPAPYTHSTKMAVLKVRRKDERR